MAFTLMLCTEKGNFIIAVDNEDRENEGDLIIAGEDLTPEKMAFMVRYTSGVICAPCSSQLLKLLEIPMMVAENEDAYKTAYTVSVDCVDTTTGISAADRARTIRALANPSSTSKTFNRPGHVFPLRGVEGGVLQRVGHTEASLDFCRLAGKQSVAAISEIVRDDGTGEMARRDYLREFARVHGLALVTISALAVFRTQHGL